MNTRQSIFYLLCLLVLSIAVEAQQRFDAGVEIGGSELVMPWNGGFNAPQFANIDFNRDGVADMISFDRQGDVLRTYIRLPASGRWIMDLQYLGFFPPLVDWVTTGDFDQDGIEDLFTSSSKAGVPGVTVYKGSYENDVWTFTLWKDRGKDYLLVPAGNGTTNLYVSWDDIPSITDVDGDGDLDILAFEPGGSFITYYANQSVEMGWGFDSLRYIVKDICWGKILENELTETVYLSDNPNMCSDGNITGEDYITPRHAGSTIMTLDVDFDGDKDAWLGDIASRRLVFLRNGLSAYQAWITEQDSQFPMEDTIVDLPFFVAAYSVQLDDDPEPEFLAAINSRALSEDRESVWRYDDDINDGPLNYSLTEKGFFQNQMIDLGTHSRPAVADINGDGLPDLVIGGYKYAEGNVTRIPSLWYFNNIGTAALPYFSRVTDDYLSMSQFGNLPTFDFAPAFGDIDGNGTIDLLVGDQNGKLFFYKNTSLPGEAIQFDTPLYPYMNINVGVSATPQIADINGDGLGDLIIGERTGNSDMNGRCSVLNYFENIGTPGSALFQSDATLAPNTQCFGRVLFDIPIGLPQYSAPSVVRTQNGWVLVTGSDEGNLLLFDELHKGKTGAITLLNDHYEQIQVGYRSAPALADLDLDGFYDLIVGNQRGGLELFRTSLAVGKTGTANPDQKSLRPYSLTSFVTNGWLELFWKHNDAGNIRLMTVSGIQLHMPILDEGPVQKMNLEGLPAGIYFLQIQQGTYLCVEKIVKL